MNVAVWIAALGLGLPVYAYAVYPVLLFGLAAVRQTARDLYYLLYRSERRTRSNRTPYLSVVIAAYNEQAVIGDTLERLLAQDYPADRLEIIVGSDGSDDDTVAVASRYGDRGVRVMPFAQRRGKLAVLQECVREARGDVLVLTDANTRLEPNALQNLARHFDSPRVGAVCGELRLEAADGTRADEGLYWRYEMMLKVLENRLNALLGANGAIYAVRKELFPKLDRQFITEDFIIPMKVRRRGYRVVYDPEAVAVEEAPSSAGDEFRRRMRIGAGNWQALRECAGLLMPWHGFVAFSFWSHKVLRWLTPFCLTAALVANLFLLPSPFWQAVLAVQAAFYAAAGTGWLLGKFRLPAGPLHIASYFVSINAALGIGLVRGLLGRQRAAWSRTRRQPLPGGGD